MSNKFKLGDIIRLESPFDDVGDRLVVSIERDYYKVVGINDAVDHCKYDINKGSEWCYDVVGNIFEKNK